MFERDVGFFAELLAAFRLIENIPMCPAITPAVAGATNRLRHMLKQKLDHVEEIIFAVINRLCIDWPKITLANGKQNLQVGVANCSRDKPCVHTFVTKGLVEVSVLAKLIENTDEEVYNVFERKSIRMGA